MNSTASSIHPPRRYFAAALLLCLATLAGYSGILNSPFNYDDGLVVLSNSSIHSLGGWLDFSDIRYRHLFYLSFAINHHLGKTDPFGYHLFNLGVHLGTSLLVLITVFLTIDRGTRWGRNAAGRVACVTALGFALNPIQTEAVTYVSGRTCSLMALFYLLSLLGFILGTLRETRWPATVLWYGLCLLAGGAAILSKETAATFPAALLLYDLCFMRSDRFKRFRWRLALIYIPIPLAIFGLVMVSPGLSRQVVLWMNKLNPGYAMQQLLVIPYAAKTVLFPINQVFDYEWPYATLSTDLLRITTSLMAVAAVLAAWVWLLLRVPVAAFGLGWYLLVLAPTNSFLPRLDLLSERNLYLPSFGLLFLLAGAADRIGFHPGAGAFKRRAVGIALGVWVLCLLALLFHRNTVYTSNITLWEDALKKNPGKPRIYHNLSYFYTKEKDYGKAFIMLKKLAISNARPYYRAYAYTNLGNLYTLRGERVNAEKAFNLVVQIYPEYPPGHFNQGVLFATKGLYEEANAAFDRARQAQARYEEGQLIPPTLSLYKARVLFKLNRLKEAEAEVRHFLRDEPGHPEGVLLLGHIYLAAGRDEQAIPLYRSITKDPHRVAEAQAGLAHMYAKRGDWDGAITALQRSLDAFGDEPSRRYELGRLLWEHRRDPAAARQLHAALALHPDPSLTLTIERLLTKIESRE